MLSLLSLWSDDNDPVPHGSAIILSAILSISLVLKWTFKGFDIQQDSKKYMPLETLDFTLERTNLFRFPSLCRNFYPDVVSDAKSKCRLIQRLGSVFRALVFNRLVSMEQTDATAVSFFWYGALAFQLKIPEMIVCISFHWKQAHICS